MITVIFPNGKYVEFERAIHLISMNDRWQLFDKDRFWIADIQLTAGVVVTPYKIKVEG